jgi:hypothetical protein
MVRLLVAQLLRDVRRVGVWEDGAKLPLHLLEVTLRHARLESLELGAPTFLACELLGRLRLGGLALRNDLVDVEAACGEG